MKPKGSDTRRSPLTTELWFGVNRSNGWIYPEGFPRRKDCVEFIEQLRAPLLYPCRLRLLAAGVTHRSGRWP